MREHVVFTSTGNVRTLQLYCCSSFGNENCAPSASQHGHEKDLQHMTMNSFCREKGKWHYAKTVERNLVSLIFVLWFPFDYRKSNSFVLFVFISFPWNKYKEWGKVHVDSNGLYWSLSIFEYTCYIIECVILQEFWN